MIDYRILLPAFLYGIIFESFGAAHFGFYLAPLMVAAFLLAALPFTIRIANLAIAWILGTSLMLFLAVFWGGGALPSTKVLIHIAAYLSPFLIIASAFYDTKR
ncbi:hypothetical protein A2661_01395 [Candidatus Giovannonibacteria bacterium RIFCSPHIGHO2_01_FULL_45_24]|uniref:Uncharacterized protein n=1 Tax=Candidatus Giovannonibacteria bacterium RIFCSPLOWO2_01_FULL_46_32 TaxID=1798353 RepID=A0A1F5XHI7_9BACT|nr:MAG: hypothetical protein A2661_01395 [Candidatus Giovannonibacteria bacterium RIFCSPHIGHO2_01_FULL_45_24]OGF87350.1 MAG: hypothetical protein A3B19_03990 [Candidatus Giovannonibacteria bacterium RIFCSPLOWO2_01_FULL_46_32]